MTAINVIFLISEVFSTSRVTLSLLSISQLLLLLYEKGLISCCCCCWNPLFSGQKGEAAPLCPPVRS